VLSLEMKLEDKTSRRLKLTHWLKRNSKLLTVTWRKQTDRQSTK